MSSTAGRVNESPVKQQIMDAAMSRFGYYGYNKTTMVEIAEDVDMSAANLYRYFKNKQQIAAACCERFTDKRIELIRTAIRQPDLSAEERLRIYIKTSLDHCFEMFSSENKIGELVVHITSEHPALIHHRIELQQSLLIEILAYGNQTGEFDVDDVVAGAEGLHTAMVVFEVPMFMTLFPYEIFERRANAVANLMLQGLLKR